MRDVPKAQGKRTERTDIQLLPSGGSKSKEKVIEESGFSKTQVQRFEELATHPEIVEQAKAEARECSISFMEFLAFTRCINALHCARV